MEYWKKTKETIHVFDRIIVQYEIQWSAIMLAMIGASALAFSTSSLVAGIISLTAIAVSFPIAIKCYFYYQLLEEALGVGLEIENILFQSDKAACDKYGLTHRLCELSKKPYLEITYFGWTIFIPFVVLSASSLTLSLFYFEIISSLGDILWSLTTILGIALSVMFLLGFLLGIARRRSR